MLIFNILGLFHNFSVQIYTKSLILNNRLRKNKNKLFSFILDACQ